MYKLFIAAVSFLSVYNVYALTDEEITAKIISKYNLPEDIMTRKTISLKEVKEKIKQKLKTEVAPEVEEKFPKSKLEKVKEEAEKKYPIIKKGDKISVKVMRGNRIEVISGFYEGHFGSKILVDHREIFINDIRDNTAKMLDMDEVTKFRRNYIKNNYTKLKNDFERPLRKEIEEEEYRNAGYVYNKRVLKWVSGKKVIQTVIDIKNKKALQARKNQERKINNTPEIQPDKDKNTNSKTGSASEDKKEEIAKNDTEGNPVKVTKETPDSERKMSEEEFSKVLFLQLSYRDVNKILGKGKMGQMNKPKTYFPVTYTYELSDKGTYQMVVGFTKRGRDFFAVKLKYRKNIDSKVHKDKLFDDSITRNILEANSLGGTWPDTIEVNMKITDPFVLQATVTSSTITISDKTR